MVSVIIPTFKRKDLLFYEIDRLLEQKNVSVEIIVVNDNIDNDPTDEIVVKYPQVIYVKNPEKVGPGKKHQIGMKLAHGEYVSFPDDDDYLCDEYFFSKASELLEKDKSLSFVSGNSYFKYEDKPENDQLEKHCINVKGKINGLEYLSGFQSKYSKPLSSFPTVFRRSTLESQQFYDQIEMSDVSIYMLALLGGDAYILEDYVGVYRVHSRSLTKKHSDPTWILGVMKQKESILEKIHDKIDRPSKWWLNHFALSYRFYANTSTDRNSKMKLLKWGYDHSHGYFIVKLYIFKQLIKAVAVND